LRQCEVLDRFSGEIPCTRPSNSPTRWDLHMINTVYILAAALRQCEVLDRFSGEIRCTWPSNSPTPWDLHMINTVYVVGSSLEAVRGARQIFRGDPLHQAFKFSHKLGPTHDQYRVYSRQQP
jgi:hypothetical protein